MIRHHSPSFRLLVLAVITSTLAGCAGICIPIPLPCFTGHHCRRMAIPDTVPLGVISRAHWHTMETNGEANDFVMYRNEFVDDSSELTPYGRDHIAEIAARMASAPFPVLVQRSYNNADPELDAARRQLVVQVLTDLGNPDADHRTVVSQAYTNGINSTEGEQDYGRFTRSRQFNNGGGNGGGGQFGF